MRRRETKLRSIVGGRGDVEHRRRWLRIDGWLVMRNDRPLYRFFWHDREAAEVIIALGREEHGVRWGLLHVTGLEVED